MDLAQKEPPTVEAQLVEVLAFDSRNHLSLQDPTGCTATGCGRGRSAHVAEISHHDKRFTRLTPSETNDASRTVRGKQGSAACRPKACMSVGPCFVASRMTWSYRRRGPAGIPVAHWVIPGGTMHADQPSEGIKKRKAQNMCQLSQRQSRARWQLCPTLRSSSSVRPPFSAAPVWKLVMRHRHTFGGGRGQGGGPHGLPRHQV